jgi:hypothetical protein
MSAIPLAQKMTHAILWAAQDQYKELAKLVYFAIAQVHLPLPPAHVKKYRLISELYVRVAQQRTIGMELAVLIPMRNQLKQQVELIAM